jgi:hypothetical protein
MKISMGPQIMKAIKISPIGVSSIVVVSGTKMSQHPSEYKYFLIEMVLNCQQ